MFHKTILSASPSSFGSRFDRSQKVSPPFSAASFEDPYSRRSSVDLSGNNAVSFPSSTHSARPPLYRETGTRTAPPPTIGFTEAPLTETKKSGYETVSNNAVGLPRAPSPGLLSLTLREETQPPICSRTSAERESRLAEQFREDVPLMWSLEKLQETHPVFGRPVVIEAYELASWAHRKQLRKSGEPVLVHCVETAKILADVDADDHIVAAALLHDVLDDTCVSLEHLQEFAPPSVTELVQKVSKLSYISQLVRSCGKTSEDWGKLKDVLIASVDGRALIIKLADRIHNMRTVSALTPSQQQEWAQETMDLFVPLAGRLGCWVLKSELEDLCFAVLHPHEYERLKLTYDAKVARFTQGGHLQNVLNEVKHALDEADVKYDDISGRPKNFYGVFRKMQRKEYSDMDDVLDLFALRIVLKDGQSCHRAMEVVHSMWLTVPEKLKDYVTHPKPNGYQSMHDVCIVDEMPLEVQIRTLKMHYLAEHGIAAHWRYKESTTDDKESGMQEYIEQRTRWSRHILNCIYALNDKKVRPDALHESPEVFRSVWKAFWSFEEQNRGIIACQHGAKIAHQTPWCPVYVLVKEVDSIQVCEAPSCAKLETFLLEHCGVLRNGGRIPVVNRKTVAPNHVLQFGDLIEFTDEQPVTQCTTATAEAGAVHPVTSSVHHQSTIVPFGESCRDPVLP